MNHQSFHLYILTAQSTNSYLNYISQETQIHD